MYNDGPPSVMNHAPSHLILLDNEDPAALTPRSRLYKMEEIGLDIILTRAEAAYKQLLNTGI